MMELLALLDPKYGSRVLDLCADLGLGRAEVAELVDRAKDRGFGLSIRNGPLKHGRIVVMDEQERNKITAAASEYVDRLECGL